jgi:Cullin binding
MPNTHENHSPSIFNAYDCSQKTYSANKKQTKQGIAALGDKLGIDVTEDIRILVLLWKMDCKDMPGHVTAQEWINGCQTLKVDSWESLLSVLPSLDPGFLEHGAEFKDFYKFCFKFNLSGTHKTLDKEVVTVLLQMVLKDRVPAERLDSFVQFLESTKEYGKITLDQWTSFYDFCQEVPEISDFDECSSAWPVMLDEYVEFAQKQLQQKNS